MTQEQGSGISLLIARALLAGFGLVALPACTSVKAVTPVSGQLGQVRLGFGLDLAGRVSPGCAASTFALRDPIHLSMYVTDATPGSVVSVAIREVGTDRLAWSEQRPVPLGHSYQTFAIGKEIARGRYRAETTLGGQAAKPWPFVVHDKREGVR